MKMLWSGIRSIINVKNARLNNISQIVQDGKIVSNPKEIAQSFNQSFVYVASSLDKDIPRTTKFPLDYLGNRNSAFFFVSPTDRNKVKNIISQLQTGKSAGPYSIPINLLKMLSPVIVSPLVILINESFSTGIFPDKLKIAKVVVLHNKGSTDNPSNHRPISLLSVFSKIFEKLMHQRLYNFLEINEILHPLQFGFRKKHSTLYTLINMTEHIKNTIDNGNYGCGIFINLKKAFDTVNHTILLKKLEHYGIRGVPLQWFKSYLSDKKQFVSVNGHSSGELEIKHGVPQGSVLGPLLFLLYINDLPSSAKKLTFYLFADDTNIYFESSDLLHLQRTVNKELRKVRKWLESNRLTLNIDKTNFVIFRSAGKEICDNTAIKIGKKKIHRENHVRFLGVSLDSALSWKAHMTELSKKLSRAVGLYYKIRHYAPQDTLILLYHGLFASLFSYGISVWGLTYPSLIDSIFVIQKKVIRVITFNKGTARSTPLFDRLQILKLYQIFQLQILSFVFECINNLSPTCFKYYFVSISDIHHIGTRQAKKGNLYVEHRNTTQYGILSIRYAGARHWNDLPTELKESKSLFSFKTKLKNHFLSSYIQDLAPLI